MLRQGLNLGLVHATPPALTFVIFNEFIIFNFFFLRFLGLHSYTASVESENTFNKTIGGSSIIFKRIRGANRKIIWRVCTRPFVPLNPHHISWCIWVPESFYAKTTLSNVYKVRLTLSLVLFKALWGLRTENNSPCSGGLTRVQTGTRICSAETRLRIKLTLENKHLIGERGQKGRWPGKDFPEEQTLDLSLKGH